MSLGNGNAKASNKGSNFSHELKTLKVLNAIGASTAASATEATLQALLAAVEASKDYEVRIVNDSNPGGEVTFLEVRYWDVQDGTLGSPVYYLPGSDTPYNIGDPGGPVAPLSYVPTSTLLAQIVAELQAVNSELDAIKLDTAAIDLNTDNLEALLTTIDAVLDDIKLDTISINSYLATIDTELQDQGVTLDSIETELQSVDDRLTAKTITPNLVRATGAGTIAPAVYSFSVANVGAADGSITIGANPAVAIKPTESFTFDAGSLNNQYAAGTIAYDGSGTELVIIFNS